MNALTHHQFQTKISFSGRKFATSVGLLDSPSTFHDRHGKTLVAIDPIQLLDEWTKSRKFTVKDANIVHARLLKTNALHSHIFVANSLVDGYCKSSDMDYALRLFESIPQRNAISWNIMISGYNQNLLFEKSWGTFCRMWSLDFEPNQITYGSVLLACSTLESYLSGMQVYALAMKNGFFSNGYVRAGTIDFFARNCRFHDALRVFYDVSCENVVCWNAIISGAVKNKEYRVALDLFFEMLSGNLLPNYFTFSSVLTACTALEELELGRKVHGRVIKDGAGDVFVGTAMVDFYAKCGHMDEAMKVFLRMPIRNVVSWTAIISGFVNQDNSVSALTFFKESRNMRDSINIYTVTSVLSACANSGMVREAVQIHCWILKSGFYSDPAVKASLINMYSKMGEVHLSEMVFRETENLQHLGTWAVMISAFAQNGSSGKAINLFQRMFQEGIRADTYCRSSVLSVIDFLDLGRQIHCDTLKAGLDSDVSVGSSLSVMYSKCGCLLESYEVFEHMAEKDYVSWASMIAGFAEHGYAYQAIQLFREMPFEEAMADEMTLTAVLTACSALQSLKTGREIHGYALRRGHGWKVLDGALVNMYSKCGALNVARCVFDTIPIKDQVACSSLVSGYAQSGMIEGAIQLFHEMLAIDLKIDSFTISSVIGALSLSDRSFTGTQLHSHVLKVGFECYAAVGSSLVMMYSKCGSIDDCHKAFEQIEKPDLICWTSMIASYAQHGKGSEALKFYELMKQSGIKPDSVTFVGILSACAHNGLIEEGYFHLNSMLKDYGIEPRYRHYTCMVDLLSRSGRLKEAERFISSMPIKPDALVWGTLLSACKVHGDVELGRLAAKKVMDLEPCDAGAYISWSNICADAGLWEEVLRIRTEMKGTGAMKEPGLSCV